MEGTANALVEDDELAKQVLHVATGESRKPLRARSEPFHFQYYALHAPW